MTPMKTTPYASVLAVVFVLMSGLAIPAHHGDAGRYEEKLSTVTGTVVEVQLINPHSILVLDVADPNGKVLRWRGELGGPTGLKRQGWGTEIVRRGDTITMRGRRLKNGSPFMTLSECARVFDAAGKELYRGNDPGQPPGGPAAGAPAAGATPADPCAGPIR